MTLPVFPPILDRPLREGFSIASGEARRLFEPEAAPVQPRARYSRVAKPVSMSLITDRNGLAIFNRFYEVTLINGALPFLMPDPITDGWPLLTADGFPLLTGAGQPILLAATWVCLFGKNLPMRVPVGVGFRISFSLGVMP